MRKGEPGKRYFFRVVVIVGGGLIATIVVLYGPWVPLFDLRGIIVSGNYHVPTEILVSQTDFHKGDNLLRLPIKRATQSLLEHPWIKTVSIRRIFPHNASVAVVERSALACVRDSTNDETLWIVAEGGIVVQKAHDTGDSPTLFAQGVVFTEEAVGGHVNDADIVRTLEVLHNQNLDKDGFNVIDFSDVSCVLLHHVTGLEVKLGPVDDIEHRIEALSTLLNTLKPDNYQLIDLRFEDEAVLVPR